MGKLGQVLFFALLSALNIAIFVKYINSPCGTASSVIRDFVNQEINALNATLNTPSTSESDIRNAALKTFNTLLVDMDLAILIGIDMALTMIATVNALVCG